MRKPLLTKLLAGAALVATASGSWAQGQVNIICSVQAEWCNLMSTVYAKTTGTKVNMTAKGSGEALAQLNAERAHGQAGEGARVGQHQLGHALFGGGQRGQGGGDAVEHVSL